MKRTIVCVLMSICFLSLVSRADAVLLMEDRWELTGYAEIFSAWSMDRYPNTAGVQENDKGQLVMFRNTIQLENYVKLTDNCQFTGIIRGFYDGSWSANDDLNQGPKNLTSMPDGEDMESDLDFREYYISYFPGNFAIKIGQQQVVWGESDILRLSDIINPLDMSWRGFFESWEDIRIPLRMIDVVYSLPWRQAENNIKLELLYNPEDFRPTRFAPEGSFWYPQNLPPGTLAGVDSQLPEKHDLTNGQVGGRVRGELGDWGLSVFTYYSLMDMPVFALNLGTMGIDFDYSRITTFGGSFNYYEQHTGTVFRGETTYTRHQAFNQIVIHPVFGPIPDTTKKNRASIMLGFDRPTWIKWINPMKTFFISGQVFYNQILNMDDDDNIFNTGMGKTGAYDHQTAFTLLMNTEMFDSKFYPEIQAGYDLGGSTMFAPVFRYEPNWTVSISIGALFVWTKDDPYKYTAGIFGPFTDCDEIYCRLRWKF